MPSVSTIGHSNHPADKFLRLLRLHGVELLADVRSHPFSRFSPHFSRKRLEQALGQASIGYLFLGDALGGRPKAAECYDAAGEVDYDRVEAQEFYRLGIERLLETLARSRVSLLCAEENPSRCHRRLLVARTLVRRGVEVSHIRGSGALEREEGLR
jgi:uncharacterized protein (DUF488 family)